MSMARANRRSGFAFLLLGVASLLFFWLTDPRWGPGVHRNSWGRLDWRHWLFVLRGSPDNLIDAANQAWLSTLVGLTGSVALVIVGLWLVTRRRV